MDKDAVISSVYYDLKEGFGSIAKTLQAARKIDASIKREDVQKFLAKQEIRQNQKRRGDNSYVPFAPREEYQIDLADFGKDTSQVYRYAFVCIDAFSKALAVVPITDKKPEQCANALDIVIKKLNIPNTVYTDDGGEFKAAFDERLKQNFLIDHIVTRTHATMAERVIRTLREGINARLAATGTDKKYWWKMVDYVVNKYNETPHMTTGEAPNDIHHLTIQDDKEWIEELRGRIAGKAHFNRKYPDIKVGDFVKLLRKPGKYGEYKTGFQAWSTERHRVSKIEYQNGDKVFFLEGQPRPYRNHEILKVEDVQKPPGVVNVGGAAAVRRRIPRRNFPAPAPAPEPPPAIIHRVPVAPPRSALRADVPRTRIRGKTADPNQVYRDVVPMSLRVHPLAIV